MGKNLDGIIQSWNGGAERLYGYSREEALGQPVAMLLPPDRIGEEDGILARIREGSSVENLETVRLARDGRTVRVALTVSPIRDGRGAVIGASHIARDIGERAELEHTVAHLASIVESSEDAIISKDLEGTILTWNVAAERIYGYTAEEAIGKSIAILLPPGQEDEESHILKRLKRGERVEHFETVRLRKDGTRVDVSIAVSPIRDRRGTIRGASHVARDIGARKAFEAQLRHTQKLESLGVMAGGVAHDFNNLLTGILANASLAASTPDKEQNIRRLLGDITSAAERAAALTRQLLAFAGKGRFVIEAVDLSSMVREISALIHTSIPRRVTLRLDLARGLPAMEADPSQLQQVVMNLVINAAEAIGDRAGEVRVVTGLRHIREPLARPVPGGGPDLPPGDYVSLEVYDNGCGMDRATLAKIFDPFFTTKFAGRGLGLAAVLGIVNGHRGTLCVDSTPGRGTAFRLLFPVARGRAPQVPRRPAVRPGRGTVLVVDDEESVRNAARNALSHFGYTVLLASGGLEAVEALRDGVPTIDLVVLDLTMPGMGGEEALQRIREVRPDVPVLLSSGFNYVEVVRRFTGQGITGFVQKPYTAAQLAAAVGNAMEP